MPHPVGGRVGPQGRREREGEEKEEGGCVLASSRHPRPSGGAVKPPPASRGAGAVEGLVADEVRKREANALDEDQPLITRLLA